MVASQLLRLRLWLLLLFVVVVDKAYQNLVSRDTSYQCLLVFMDPVRCKQNDAPAGRPYV
jgi:hypothetical protein